MLLISTIILSSIAGATRQLSTNGRFIAPQYPGNLNLGLSYVHQCLNLIMFDLAEFV